MILSLPSGRSWLQVIAVFQTGHEMANMFTSGAGKKIELLLLSYVSE